MTSRETCRGFSMLELMVTVGISALVFAALAGVAEQATRARDGFSVSTELNEQAAFAMQRMVRSVRVAPRVLVPRAENAGTAHSEAVRDVLAMTLDAATDMDGNGIADADNDGDGLIDEDAGEDMTYDGVAGIAGVDDDGDGSIDEGDARDDDEDGIHNEDPVDGLDNDGDGAIDEDAHNDMNGDGKAGVAGVDDDGDSSIDEGSHDDDDEDDTKEEDWLDVRVYRLQGGVLLERLPDPGGLDGTDFTERPVVQNVTQFRVEYVPPPAPGRPALIDITLTVESEGESVSLQTRTRAVSAQ